MSRTPGKRGWQSFPEGRPWAKPTGKERSFSKLICEAAAPFTAQDLAFHRPIRLTIWKRIGKFANEELCRPMR